MLSEAKKVKMIAWDTECLDGKGKVQSMQFCLGKDKLYFVPMSLDNYVRQTFNSWFPALMSYNNMKVTFANTENRWLLEVYSWLRGDWLQISRHVDIQEILYLRTNIIFGLKNAHNLFFPRSEWKEERVQMKYSIDVMYSVIDAAATYNVANHVLINSELVSDIDLSQSRERIHEDINKKPIVSEENKSDITFDVDQLSTIKLKEEHDQEPVYIVNVPIMKKSNIEPVTYSINFSLIDDSDKDYFKSLGLEMVGSAQQMVAFFEKQTHLVRSVICEIMMERLKNRPVKPLECLDNVVSNRKFIVDGAKTVPMNYSGRQKERVDNFVRVNQEPINPIVEQNEDVKSSSQQYREFKIVVNNDSSYKNRIRAGGVTLLLQELKIQFDLIETHTGLDHERIFKVTLEVFQMKFIGINKNLKDARNGAKNKFVESLFVSS